MIERYTESEETFFEQKERVSGSEQLSSNRIWVTSSSSGIMKGNIEVTNKGDFGCCL